MKEYMLVAKAKPGVGGFRDSQDRKIFMERFQVWERELTEKKQFIRSDILSTEYKKVAQNEEKMLITDGPFAETKEIISGFFLVAAKNMEEAVEITKDCPILRFDDLEIYEIKRGL